MDIGEQIYVNPPGESRQAGKTPSQCHITSVDTGLSNDYESSQGHLGSLSESKRVSNDFSDKAPVLHDESGNGKHDNHAVLVPIRRGTELGYFSTMSTVPCLNQGFS